uniref:galactinol--sucrose galactosyltransferase n=1 Tax=Cajanus cajan TaxID=3821 RepID=A0A151RYG1_CAJCA|nr:Stachyose synthase [Cajanus cajan]
MAPPDDTVNPTLELKSLEKMFDLSDGKFTVRGVPLLSQVPNNVTFSSFSSLCEPRDAPPSILQRVIAASHKGGFFGFSQVSPSDRLTTSLGSFSGRSFLSIFRFKTWWSTQWVGNSGSDLQKETQWVLIEIPETKSYVVIIPIIESSFRSALHPGSDGHVMICAETGSTQVKASTLGAIAYVHVAENPYNLMREAYSALRVHLGSFRLLEEKTVPRIVDKFGWCTWDAFYLTVNPVGVWHGLKDFAQGGVSPRFLIIDDGWQSLNFDGDDPNQDAKNLVLCGEQMNARLHRFDEGKECGGCCSKAKESGGIKAFTRDLRSVFKGLDDVYVWHALCGAWGGVRPGATHLDSKIIPCKLSPGLDGTMEDLAVVKIVEGSIGLVHPHQANDFYHSMHSYLAQSGISGVKVDVIHCLEYACEEYGGRVELAKAYYDGLSNSIVKNFNGNGIIASMQQCNDFFFLGTKQIAMGRAGDDFWFQDPNGDPMGVFWLQGVHMIHCSYNSLWMGQMIQPDWDMFQSDHVCAKFHAGSRAICGGPVYLSDSVGSHDFDLIKKLAFPDGTVPKCIYFALPTRDCLFNNPLFDHKTVLKIWNFNKYGGVIGAFNCQGAGWDPKVQKIRGFPECYKPISCTVHVTEVEWDQNKEASHMGKADEYVVYLNQAEELHLMTHKCEPLQFTIQPTTFELYNFVPLTKLGGGIIKFAPIGLTNMFNSGGTIQELEYVEKGAKLKVKGGGRFLAYSSESPKKLQLNGSDAAFEWLPDGKLTLNLAWIEDACGVSDLAIFF